MSKTYELSYTAERIDEMLKEVDEHTIYSDATTEEHGLMSATDKTKLDALPTALQIDGALNAKVDKVEGKGLSENDYTDAEKESVASAYHKPQNGIPKTDLASDVQTSLGKADTAIQKHQDISGKADKSDTYTKSEVDAKVTSVMRYKGSVNSYAALSAIQNPSIGDVYNVLDTGHNYAYDGTSWDVLSGIVSVDGKADKVSNATNGNFASLDANGNLTDSGKKASDFATVDDSAVAANKTWSSQKVSGILYGAEGSQPAIGRENTGQYAGTYNTGVEPDLFYNNVSLDGSNNGAFTMPYLVINGVGTGAMWKSTADDICPIRSYITAANQHIGANHGIACSYTMTSANHGLTNKDIGRTCVASGKTCVIWSVPTGDTFCVIPLWPDGLQGVGGLWPIPKSVDLEGTTMAVSCSGVQQIEPVAKNISVEVTKNDAESFEITESYDIIDIADAMHKLTLNVRHNTATSYLELGAPKVNISNRYCFYPNQSMTVYTKLTVIRPFPVVGYGGVQSMSFGNDDWICIPQTDYDTFMPNTDLPETANFLTSDTWKDSSKPPRVYLNLDANKTKMFALVYPVDYDRAEIGDYCGAGYIYKGQPKMYPYFVSHSNPPALSPAGTVYEFPALRLPMIKAASGINFSSWAKVGSDWWLFAYNLEAGGGTFTLPEDARGRQLTVVESSNCTATMDGFNPSFAFSGEGYVLAKVSGDKPGITDDIYNLDGRVDELEKGKAEKITVETTQPVGGMLPNTIYDCGELSALTITLPLTITADYISQVNFSSGSTATQLTAPATIVWDGDSIDTNVLFVPEVNMRYTVMLYSDGSNVLGIVRGTAVPASQNNNE